MSHPRLAGLVLCLTAATTVSLHSQQRVIHRANLPRNLDSAMRAGSARVVDSATAQGVSRNAPDVVLERGQFIAARVADAPRVVRRPPPLGVSGAPATTVIELPFLYYGSTAANRSVNLRPAVIRESPLRYRPKEGSFRGSLLVALENSVAPAARESLAGPVRLTFVTDGDSITPGELDLTFTNRPLMRVTVVASQPRDSVRVQVVPEFDLRGGVPIWLPVQPMLELDGGPRSISGLGIQTGSFPVRVRGASIRTPVTIALVADRGYLLSDRVRIDSSGSATLRLRSAGIGPARITATSPGMDPAQTTVHFRWPISFLLAALLGGAIGGLTAQTKRRAGRKGSTRKALLTGVLIGFVVAVVYYAIDVNLLQLDVTVPFFDEAAVFALALLGGAFGIRTFQPKGT